MKELEIINKDEVKIVKEVKQEKKIVKLGTIFPHSGHKCFEYNIITNELTLARFSEQAIDYTAAQKGEIAKKRKVMTRENCTYITALNYKNATKHFEKQLGRKLDPTIVKI